MTAVISGSWVLISLDARGISGQLQLASAFGHTGVVSTKAAGASLAGFSPTATSSSFEHSIAEATDAAPTPDAVIASFAVAFMACLTFSAVHFFSSNLIGFWMTKKGLYNNALEKAFQLRRFLLRPPQLAESIAEVVDITSQQKRFYTTRKHTRSLSLGSTKLASYLTIFPIICENPPSPLSLFQYKQSS